jgi:hypothetical protein
MGLHNLISHEKCKNVDNEMVDYLTVRSVVLVTRVLLNIVTRHSVLLAVNQNCRTSSDGLSKVDS